MKTLSDKEIAEIRKSLGIPIPTKGRRPGVPTFDPKNIKHNKIKQIYTGKGGHLKSGD